MSTRTRNCGDVSARWVSIALIAGALSVFPPMVPAAPAAAAATPASTPMVLRSAGFDIQVIGDLQGFVLTSHVRKLDDGV